MNHRVLSLSVCIVFQICRFETVSKQRSYYFAIMLFYESFKSFTVMTRNWYIASGEVRGGGGDGGYKPFSHQIRLLADREINREMN